MALPANKLHVYEAVYHFNRSLHEMIGELKNLERMQLFPRSFLRSCRQTAEELQATANRKFTEVLNTGETKDERRLSRIRTGSRKIRKSSPA